MTHPQSPASHLPEAAEPVAQAPAQAGEVMVQVPAETLSRWRKWCLGYEWPKVQDWDSHDAFLAIADEIRTKYEQPFAQHQEATRGQWWIKELEYLWGGSTADGYVPTDPLDVRRAAKIACDFVAAALATPQAQPVLAPVVREPLSDERIDQLFLDAHAQGYGMGWQECGRRFARAVIQATTGEQSHG